MKELDPNQTALLAEWAEVEGFAGELVEERSVIGRRGGQQQCSGSEVEELAAAGDLLLGLTVGQEAEVADADES